MQHSTPTLGEHNGIRLLANDLPVQFAGSLVFGVGLRDEEPRYAGVAHLAEHVVMSRIGRLAVSHDAMTADDSITFYAQGAPDQVAGFLNRVATSITGISDITDEDVDAQRRIIAAELGEDGERTGDGPLLARLGARDLGLLDLGSPANRSITRQMVIDFVRRWFTSANAVITMTGATPDSLDIALPDGAPIARDTSDIVAAASAVSGWMLSEDLPMGLSFVLQTDDAAVRVMTQFLISESLHHALRNERKLIYSVSSYSGVLDFRSRLMSIILDPVSSDVLDAADGALRVMRDLAANGPSTELLQFAQEGRANALADPQFHAEGLGVVATAILREGLRQDQLATPDTTSVTAEQVRDVVAAALPTILVLLSGNAPDVDLDELTVRLGLPEHERSASRYMTMSATQISKSLLRPGVQLFNPKLFRGMRGAQLIVDDEHVALASRSAGVFEVRFDDLVMAGVNVQKPEWDLTTRTGTGIVIDADDWRAGSKLVAALEKSVPLELRYAVHARDAEPTEADIAAAAGAHDRAI